LKIRDPDSTIVLRCCVCDQLATRKCLGMMDDAAIAAAMSMLSSYQREQSQQQRKKMSQGIHVLGMHKLKILMNQLNQNGDGGQDAGHQQVILASRLREVLERSNAECDECYCVRCYKQAHTSGKRLHHKYVY